MWNQDASTDNKTSSSSKVASLGGSVLVKGEITGSEDLTIDGRVEGRIDLSDHVLTVGPNAKMQANISAKIVIIFGSVDGTITAREKVDVRSSASVQGSITCSRISVQEGATVNGKIETPKGKSGKQSDSNKTALVA
jgi:cytoskeletal protein CcmA (bactofilin family)